MNKAMLGTALSGLVFPGLGQVVLGRRTLGVLLMILSSTGLAGCLSGYIQRLPALISLLMEQAEHNGLDPLRSFSATMQWFTTDSGSLERFSLWLLGGCWLFSLIHAYLIGTALDRHPPSSPE